MVNRSKQDLSVGVLNRILEATFREVDRIEERENDRAWIQHCHGFDNPRLEDILVKKKSGPMLTCYKRTNRLIWSKCLRKRWTSRIQGLKEDGKD